jgi:hypothetical protein
MQGVTSKPAAQVSPRAPTQRQPANHMRAQTPRRTAGGMQAAWPQQASPSPPARQPSNLSHSTGTPSDQRMTCAPHRLLQPPQHQHDTSQHTCMRLLQGTACEGLLSHSSVPTTNEAASTPRHEHSSTTAGRTSQAPRGMQPYTPHTTSCQHANRHLDTTHCHPLRTKASAQSTQQASKLANTRSFTAAAACVWA